MDGLLLTSRAIILNLARRVEENPSLLEEPMRTELLTFAEELNMENKIVKFNGRFWVVHSIKNNTAILWRDGERAIAPLSQCEITKERTLNHDKD